jgi:hypothetical protein
LTQFLGGHGHIIFFEKIVWGKKKNLGTKNKKKDTWGVVGSFGTFGRIEFLLPHN